MMKVRTDEVLTISCNVSVIDCLKSKISLSFPFGVMGGTTLITSAPVSTGK